MDSIEILVPELPESVMNATVIVLHKKINDIVHRNEIIVEIETDKVIMEIQSPEDGIIESINCKEGDIVFSKQVLGTINCNKYIKNENNINTNKKIIKKKFDINQLQEKKYTISVYSPSLRRIISKNSLNIDDIILKKIYKTIKRKDIHEYIINTNTNNISSNSKDILINSKLENEKRIPMTRIRKCIAEKLLISKNSTAMLTTFNEVNMQKILELRKKYCESFKKRHGINLGLMSFYVKAVVEALKRYPQINARIDGEDIVYYNYFDINIAIDTIRGLVTPVLRNININSLADIEIKIKELANKANNGKLKLDELDSGNFTITNGGKFGSLFSTPIINLPQSAILGMHTIKKRPMVIDDNIVILPMMYLALSYDHRLIDGKDSIGFLLTIKEIIEDPIRINLDI